jgi:hypothetical protein
MNPESFENLNSGGEGNEEEKKEEQEQEKEIEGEEQNQEQKEEKEREEKIKEVLSHLRGFEIKIEDKTIGFSEEDLSMIGERLANVQIEIFKNYISIKKEEFSEWLKNNFQENLKNLSLTPEDWKKCCLEQPSLFTQSPETINNNIEGVARLLGISKEDYISKAALEYPQLFAQSPETINNNIEGVARLLGLSKEEYINKAALKQPSLFYQSPETINNNIEGAAILLGLSKEEYINKAALKQPSLFTRSPETIVVKFKLCKEFIEKAEEDLRKDVLKYPQLLTYAPERIIAHYVLAKLADRELKIRPIIRENPLTYAKKVLEDNPERLRIFETLYNYFKKGFEKKRKERRKRTDEAKEEAKLTLRYAELTQKYFGRKRGILTPEMIYKIQEKLVKPIREKERGGVGTNLKT